MSKAGSEVNNLPKETSVCAASKGHSRSHPAGLPPTSPHRVSAGEEYGGKEAAQRDGITSCTWGFVGACQQSWAQTQGTHIVL